MIFVTVGTHEQQFNRLIKEIDTIKGNGILNDSIFIQTGYCDYVPMHCESSKFLEFEEMKKKIDDARIVITHGGPSSFMNVIRVKKVPIVVPRLKLYGEHINNHQVEFIMKMNERKRTVIPVFDISELSECLENYSILSEDIKEDLNNNTRKFSNSIKQIAFELLK